MTTWDMPKGLGLFYVIFLTDPLYVQWGNFITVQVTLKIPSHLVPLNFLLGFKILRLNLLNIVIFLTLWAVLGGQPPRIRTIWTIFNLIFSMSTLKLIYILWFQMYVVSPRRISINLFINNCSYID